MKRATLYRWRPMEKRSDANRQPGIESQISHVIPSLELKGTREQKLHQLDAAITHLEEVRYRIAGQIHRQTAADQPSADATPAWLWLVTGLLIALVPMLLWLTAAWR
jgi:hypothetical protein